MITGTDFPQPAQPRGARTSSRKWWYLILLCLIWGSSYMLIKKGLLGFGYVQSATIRLVSAGLVVLPAGLYYATKIRMRQLPLIVLSGLLGMFIPAYLFSLSQQHVQSSVAGILIAMTPSFTFLFSVFFFKKRYSRPQLAGLVLGLLCSVTLSLWSPAGLSLSINRYVLLIVLATLCYGMNINLVKYYLSEVPSVVLSTVSVMFNGVLALVLVFLPNRYPLAFRDDQLIPLLALLTLGIVGTALAQLFHNKLITISSPLFASTTTYLIPLVAIFWGVLDQERLTGFHFVASMGILVSVYLIRQEKRQ